MNNTILGGAIGLSMMASAAIAGPVTDFEADFRQMYGTYRAALFQTNTGKQESAVKTTGALVAVLGEFGEGWKTSPPPHLADDPLWGETLAQAETLAAKAAQEASAGQAAEAHETLEGIRDLFGDMRLRNGQETFSDRMNAYHTEMEHVLMADLAAADPALLREQAAVLSYLAKDIVMNPPAETSGSDEYTKLVSAFSASVEAFLTATRTGDGDAIKVAVEGLKKPYAKLFVKFG